MGDFCEHPELIIRRSLGLPSDVLSLCLFNEETTPRFSPFWVPRSLSRENRSFLSSLPLAPACFSPVSGAAGASKEALLP
jgi:hypothetical protein